MAGIDQNTLWKFANMILGKSKAQPTTRERATFLRTDPDGTQWVRLPSSNDETPVNGRTLATAKAGDTVEWSIHDGRLSITGNESQPSVGMREVFQTASDIVQPVVARISKVNELAALSKSVADAAQQVADAVNQHFFSDTNGVHVTEATQDDWNESHEGANVLLNATGQLFRDGLVNLLTLTTESGARALTVWDGLGNAASNIRAVIGETIQLGSTSSGNYMTLDSDGVEIHNAANFGAKIAYDLVSLLSGSFTMQSEVEQSSGHSMESWVRHCSYIRHKFYSGATSPSINLYDQKTTNAETGTVSYSSGIKLSGPTESDSTITGTYQLVASGDLNSIALRANTAGNRGLYDIDNTAWILYRPNDTSNIVINGDNFSVASSGSVSAGTTVTARGTNNVALYSSASSGDMGLRDMTNSKWIIYRHHDYGIVLGNSVADSLYHRTSTCTVNSTNATIYNSVNYCWHNNAVCTVYLSVNLKSSLANGNTVDVATAPANYRPPHAVMGSVYVTGQNVNLQAELLGTGIIRVNNRSGSAVTTSANIYISFTFAL